MYTTHARGTVHLDDKDVFVFNAKQRIKQGDLNLIKVEDKAKAAFRRKYEDKIFFLEITQAQDRNVQMVQCFSSVCTPPE